MQMQILQLQKMQKLFCINTQNNAKKHARAAEQITSKTKRNEKKENERKKEKRTKKRKTNGKKKKCNKDILRMYEKVYSFSIKYHAIVIFLTTLFLFFRNIS